MEASSEVAADFLGTLAKFDAISPFDADAKKYNQYFDVLKTLTGQLKESVCRESLREADVKHIHSVIAVCYKKLKNDDKCQDVSISETELCCECFRVLRNSCAQCQQNQDLISTVNILPVVKQLLDLSATKGRDCEKETVALRCGVQFIGNYVAGNQSTQMSTWQTLFPDTFLNIFKFNDTKASQYVCMVIYNCLNDLSTQQLIKHPDGLILVEFIIQCSQTESHPDFGLLILEELLQNNEFIMTQLEGLSSSSETVLLELMAAKLDSPASEECDHTDNLKIPAFTIAFLAEIFETQASGIVQSAVAKRDKDKNDVESVLVIHLLQVLCLATCRPQQYGIIQSRTSLLTLVLELLHKAHLAGKSGNNVFSTKQTLSGQEDNIDNPLHGFKSDLIRLIGNLTYRNKNNQDLVRELQGIPLLLDHCNVDEYNPYMNQWAIFAIHNLCEDNTENQAFIANMQRTGIADSEVLTNMGIEVQERNGKLYVKSTKKSHPENPS